MPLFPSLGDKPHLGTVFQAFPDAVKPLIEVRWIVLTVTVMLISLSFDVTDIVRYTIGHPM